MYCSCSLRCSNDEEGASFYRRRGGLYSLKYSLDSLKPTSWAFNLPSNPHNRPWKGGKKQPTKIGPERSQGVRSHHGWDRTGPSSVGGFLWSRLGPWVFGIELRWFDLGLSMFSLLGLVLLSYRPPSLGLMLGVCVVVFLVYFRYISCVILTCPANGKPSKLVEFVSYKP